MNPCHGLLRLRTAEAKAWRPLTPHFQAALARLDPRVRAWLPAMRTCIAGTQVTRAGLACRLLLHGHSSRRSVSSRWHLEMVGLLSEASRGCFSLWRLCEAARLGVRINGGTTR